MVDFAETIWRDFETDGVPSSGLSKPRKAKIREWGTWVEGIITAFTSNGGLIFNSKAQLDATLTYGPFTLAWVVTDPTPANNGIYQKSANPGFGSWSRKADLPYSFIRLSDAGAGTANAIQLTSSIPTSPSVLRVANVFEANTGDVTISENGAAARSLRTNSGNQVAAGGLVAGGMIVYVDDGTNFRLLSDQVSAAIQAAAEAAAASAQAWAEGTEPGGPGTMSSKDWAQAAMASVSNAFPVTRAVMVALSAGITSAFLLEDGREGQFTKNSADLSATLLGTALTSTAVDTSTDTITRAAHGLITGNAVITTTAVGGLSLNTLYYVIRVDADSYKLATSYNNAIAGTVIDLAGSSLVITVRPHFDPNQGFYVTLAGDVTGASGAWVRVDRTDSNVKWFGANPANADNSEAFAGSVAALQIGDGKKRIFVPAGQYKFATGPAFNLINKLNVTIFGENNQAAISPLNGASLIATGSNPNKLISIDGCQAVEISHLEIAYDSASYAQFLIDFRQLIGSSNTSGIHVHNCRFGGKGLNINQANLIKIGNCYGVTIEDCWFNRHLLGILGADTGEFANTITLKRLKFSTDIKAGGVPIRMGGNTWIIEGCIFEPNLNNNVSAAIQTTTLGMDGLAYIGNHHDDGLTTGTWFSANNGPITGGIIAGNWFRNAALAMHLGSSQDLTLLGNAIWALENTPPINPGTSQNITALGHYLHTDSGNNLPATLFTGLPGGVSLIDNKDGHGIRLVGNSEIDGKLQISGSAAAGATMRFVAGVAPTSPVNGDFWFDGTNFKARVGGVTKTFTLT